MIRVALFLLTGALAGSVAAWLVLKGGNPVPGMSSEAGTGPAVWVDPLPDAERAAVPPATEVDILERALVDPSRLAAARVAVYEQAARSNDPATLEFLIQSAAAEPRSRGRELRLEALLLRLAEIEPGRAVRVAESLVLDLSLLKPLYQAWAIADRDAALGALARMRSPYKQREVAVGLLEVLGRSDEVIVELAAALPESAASGFEADAIVARAASDPAAALSAAIALEDPRMLSSVLQQIANAVVRHDPLAALAAVSALEDPDLRRNASRSLLSAWNHVDSAAMFAYLESGGMRELGDASLALMVAQTNPERMLALSDQLPPAEAAQLRQNALRYLANQDPATALTHIERIPPGSERDALLQSIGQAYARNDPDAALAWVRSLPPPSERVMRSVIQGIAEVDFDRAIDLVIAELETPGTSAEITMFGGLFGLPLRTSDGTQSERLLDRLLAIEDGNPQLRSMVQSTMSSWVQSDREGALSWIRANAHRVPSAAMADVASRVAREDPQVAMQMLAGLTAEQRNAWIPGVAAGMAANDPAGAMRFLAQYRGQPAYAAGYGDVIMQWARVDPAGAASALSQAPAEVLARGSSTVASQWARTDPEAAARWAASVADPAARETANRMIATAWAQRDPDAARRWTLGQAPGAARDASLLSLISFEARSGSLDSRLLDALSSDRAREQALSNGITQIARQDPGAGQRLLDRYVSDPALRRQIEQTIDRANSMISSTSIVIQ